MKKLSNTQADLKKALLIKKACTSSLAKFSIFQFLITMLFWIKSILIHEYQHKSTPVNTNQHESTRINTSLTRVNMSPTRVNTNQHESNKSQHESDTSQHESTRV